MRRKRTTDADLLIPASERDAVVGLTKQLKEEVQTLSVPEARFLVKRYYDIQEYRMTSENQARALSTIGAPIAALNWFFENLETLEAYLKRALDIWTDKEPIGRWQKSITGIGPVIAAGFLANLDITRAPYVGHFWRYAGLDPTSKWGKGERRPYNADLKVLCWKLGESFVKVSGNENDIYGHAYKARKLHEQAKNEKKEYAEQAAEILRTVKIGADTEAYAWYSQGMLPPAHIHRRSCRWAVKLYLAHLHHAMYLHQFGTEPPMPYIIEHHGHAHYIAPPNLHLLQE